MQNKDVAPKESSIKEILHKKCRNHSLQSMPVVAVKLLQVSRQKNASAATLEKIIETDPALATGALKMVNSARYAISQTIHSIKHAVAMIGFDAIRSLALEISLYNHILSAPKNTAFNRVHFWRHCLSVATLSRLIARDVGYQDAEEAYTAGLLHDIGKILLTGQNCLSYDDFTDSLEQNTAKQIIELEREIVGLGHDDIGAFCCAEWKLPARITQTIRLHHRRFYAQNLDSDTVTLLSIIAFANYLAWIQGIGSIETAGHPLLQPEIDSSLEIQRLDLPKLLKNMEVQVQEAAAFYGFQLPSCDQLRTSLVHANISLSRLSSKYYFLHADLQGRLHSLSKLKRCMVKPHHSLDINRIIPSTLQAVHEIFHYDRLFLLGMNKTTRTLTLNTGRDQLSVGRSLPATELAITPELSGLSHCLREKKPLLLTRAYSTGSALLDLLQLDELGLVPVVNSSKFVGLLGVDNHMSRTPIQLADLAALKSVTDELGMALENAENFKAIQRRSQYDAMTKLYNRQTMESALHQIFEKAKSADTLFTVGLVDVDFFKKFNDIFGHQAGDSVLKLVAGVLRKFCRLSDKVGRWGGEEFLFVIDTASLTDAIAFAERLRLEVEKLGHLLQKRFPGQSLTVSIGLSAYEQSHLSLQELVDCADKALYLAKNQGRNRVVAYQSRQNKAGNF